MHNGGRCIHTDDMPQILSEILQSDLLLFSFPLYCYGMPAPFKALIDRTVALFSMTMQKVGERYAHVGQADYSKLRYLMICGCGFPNAAHNFEPAIAQFRLMFGSDSTIVTVSEAPKQHAPATLRLSCSSSRRNDLPGAYYFCATCRTCSPVFG